MLFYFQPANWQSLMLSLLMAHFAADFALQSEKVALGKCPNKAKGVNWMWWMLGHTSLHGLFVLLLTNSAFLGGMEMATHSLIDYLKCKGKYNLLTDQFLHVICKVIWTYAFFKYF